MPSDGKTELQRDILLTWYENPSLTNKEIAEACDCSASYVSDVKNRFDDYNSMEARMDREDKEMQRMFGEDIFSGSATSDSTPDMNEQRGLAEIYEDLPDNAVGNIARGIILLITLYVAYQIGTVLIL
jgi:DNA-directed RNA polymerase sigma subunit (sigma70/sigma32)